MQELYARLTTYNFTAAIVKTLSPDDNIDPLDTPSEEDNDNKEETVGIAFSQALTSCRELLVKQPLSFIKNAIKIIKGHTFVKRVGRQFVRKVKPQSNRPFCYKTS